MSKKALYRHEISGDLFVIEIDENGKVISTSGLLLIVFGMFAIGTLSVVLHEVARIRKVAVNN